MKPPPDIEYLNAVSQLMTATRAFLNGLELIPRETSATDAILLALVSKSVVLTEAIVCLISNGFADEAFGLSRTSVELQLTIRYLTNNDTISRCRRYFLYYAKDKSEWFRLINRYYPGLNPKKRSDAKELEQLASAYRSPHKWAECPNGVKDFASEPDSFEKRDDGSPLDELFYYEVLYKWMSHYVHVTEPCIDPAHITFPGDRFKVYPGVGRSSLGNNALRTSFLSVNLNLIRVFRYFNMTYPESLQSKYEQVVRMHVTGEDTATDDSSA